MVQCYRSVLPSLVVLVFLAPIAAAQPPENDTCAGAVQMWSGGGCGFLYNGSTWYANDDYDPYVEDGGCTGIPAPGRDVTFWVELSMGGLIYMGVEARGWHPMMYVVTDCGDVAGTCQLGTGGQPEFAEIAFVASKAGIYYLILDGATVGGRGQFRMSGIVGSVLTAVEPVNWSTVKARSR